MSVLLLCLFFVSISLMAGVIVLLQRRNRLLHAALTDQNTVIEALNEQYTYADALARCAQILFNERDTTASAAHCIQQVLAIMHRACDADQMILYFNNAFDPQIRIPQQTFSVARDAFPKRLRLPNCLEPLPSGVAETLVQEGWAVGTAAELLQGSVWADRHPQAHILLMSCASNALWRGYLAVCTAPLHDVCYSPAQMEFLRTGLDQIALFLQQHETIVTLRTREQLLSITQSRQAALLHALPNTLLGLDHRGYVRFVHNVADSPLKLPQQIPGRPLYDVVPSAFAEALLAAQAHTQPGQIPPPVPYTQEAGVVEGQIVTVNADEWLLIIRDITAQSQLQLRLEQARDQAEMVARMKSTFVASMSHEIRTPLNAVIGMTGLLQETPLTAEQHGFMNTISTAGRALLEVIDNILDFSRLDAGQVSLELKPFALIPFLTATVDLVAQSAQCKGIQLDVELDPDLPVVIMSDAGRLRQVLLNVLTNAIKFTAAGQVRVQVCATPYAHDSQMLTFTVADTGIGMTAEECTRIFQPFVQADRTTARRFGGSGLGLAISQQIVTLMNGQIAVESIPQVGSTFTIQIPCVIADLADLPTALAPMISTQQLHILIVEDNPINQEVTLRLVQRMGHHAVVVEHGRAAVTAVQQMIYDLILMDVHLPELDGISATAQIRALGDQIVQPYIIGLTASALAGDREHVMAAGMDAYLSKPVTIEVLQEALLGVPVRRKPELP